MHVVACAMAQLPSAPCLVHLSRTKAHLHKLWRPLEVCAAAAAVCCLRCAWSFCLKKACTQQRLDCARLPQVLPVHNTHHLRSLLLSWGTAPLPRLRASLASPASLFMNQDLPTIPARARRLLVHPNPHTLSCLPPMHAHAQMLEDLRDQCNEFVADCVMDVKAPRPYDPMLADQYIGIANYGKVRGWGCGCWRGRGHVCGQGVGVKCGYAVGWGVGV